MSLSLIESEIQRFLFSKEPEVICITGKWGVGKTFAWNKYVVDAKTQGKIALKRYSYISLFGINSLDDLKYAVFENSVGVADIGLEPNFEDLQSHKKFAADYLGRKLAGIVQQTPFLKNYVGGIVPAWFSAVNQLKGVLKAIESPNTPPHLKDALGRRAIELKKQLKRKKSRGGLLSRLGF